MKHNFIISIYKKSELNLINFHLRSLAKCKFDNELIFNLIINPELYEHATGLIDNQDNIKITFIKGISSFFTPYDEGSYHHSANLLFGLDSIDHKNKVVTFIDPDFLFIDMNFSNTILKLHNNYPVVGMRWDLSSTSKWTDFVAPHFFSINFANINRDLLSFSPELNVSEKKRKFAMKLKYFIINLQKTILRYPASLLLVPLFTIYKLNISRDTLSYLRDYTKSNNIPVFLFNNQLNIFNYNDLCKVRKTFPRILRNWLPEILGVIPRINNQNTYSFIKKIYPKEYEYMRPEEILYNKKPFALHMRTVKNIHRDANIEDQQINFLKKIHNENGYIF